MFEIVFVIACLVLIVLDGRVLAGTALLLGTAWLFPALLPSIHAGAVVPLDTALGSLIG